MSEKSTLVRHQDKPIRLGFHCGRFDTFPQVYRLERRRRALELLDGFYRPSGKHSGHAIAEMIAGRRHTANRLNEQFAALLVPSLLIGDARKALAAFRSVVPTDSDEELAKLPNDQQFFDIHKQVQEILKVEDAHLRARCEERLAPGGPFDRADHDAYLGSEGPSFSDARGAGIKFVFPPESYAALLRYQQAAGDGQIPLLERLKNDRGIHIGDFRSTKPSLVIHDLIDHIWFMEVLEREGITDRYSFLLGAVGNAGLRRAFSRESEMIASIAFGVRYRHSMRHSMQPVVRPEVLLTILMEHPVPIFDRATAILRHCCRVDDASEDAGGNREVVVGRSHDARPLQGLNMASHARTRQLEVARHRRSVEYHSLGFAFSNYIVELDEQRRKHGKIKVFDGLDVVGELNPWSPAFIAFFVDAHHELCRSSNKHLDTLTKAHIIVEEFLLDIATGRRTPAQFELLLRPDDLERFSPLNSHLPLERIQWIRENPGFLASKRPLADS